jgi:hypothetical protein
MRERSGGWWVVSCLIVLGCDTGAKPERRVGASDLPGASVTFDGEGWQSAPFPTLEQCSGDEEPVRWIKVEGKGKSEGLLLAHPLGRIPDQVLAYIALDEDGCQSTPAGGETLVIDYVGPEEVRVHNKTQELFYLRVVLR